MLEKGKDKDGAPLTCELKENLRQRIYAMNSRKNQKLQMINLKQKNS